MDEKITKELVVAGVTQACDKTLRSRRRGRLQRLTCRADDTPLYREPPEASPQRGCEGFPTWGPSFPSRPSEILLKFEEESSDSGKCSQQEKQPLLSKIPP